MKLHYVRTWDMEIDESIVNQEIDKYMRIRNIYQTNKMDRQIITNHIINIYGQEWSKLPNAFLKPLYEYIKNYISQNYPNDKAE